MTSVLDQAADSWLEQLLRQRQLDILASGGVVPPPPPAPPGGATMQMAQAALEGIPQQYGTAAPVASPELARMGEYLSTEWPVMGGAVGRYMQGVGGNQPLSYWDYVNAGLDVNPMGPGETAAVGHALPALIAGAVRPKVTAPRLEALYPRVQGLLNPVGAEQQAARVGETEIGGFLGRHVRLSEGGLGKSLIEVPQEYPWQMRTNWPIQETSGDLFVPTSQRKDMFEGLSKDGQRFLKQFQRDDFRNRTAIHYNNKTGLSLDFSTSCPKRGYGGCGSGACAYCYVEHERILKGQGETGAKAKNMVENDYEDEILRMPAELVTNLNRDGGLRMFSFGDFRPDIDDANVARALEDAKKRGLYIKAITKEPELIRRFGDHPNFRANLSIDYIKRDASNAFTVEDAMAIKAGRPNIKIRGVALNRDQAERMAADPRIDVITLYHGKTGDSLLKIVMDQNPKLADKFGGVEGLRAELNSWENMIPKNSWVKDFMARNKGRVCCGGGNCATDPHTKCGFGTPEQATGAIGTIGAILPGVYVAEWFGEDGDGS